MFIALLGLPGAGKSTLARALTELLGGVALLEPEEKEWPEFVRRPHPNGDFTRLSWFRSQRVPLYYEAQALSSHNKTAIMDSYYDKWCEGWLGKSGFAWLISPSDPYMPLATAMARLDRHLLPAADAVVLLEIDHELWLEQLEARGRAIDRDSAFVDSHHGQSHIIEAAVERSEEDGTVLLCHQRTRLSPRAEAIQLRDALSGAGLPIVASK
jgi:adenylate kinase family enzyme